MLLVVPSTTYRVGDFLDAARALGVEVVVGGEDAPVLQALMGTRALHIPLLDAEGAGQDWLVKTRRELLEGKGMLVIRHVDALNARQLHALASALGCPLSTPWWRSTTRGPSPRRWRRNAWGCATIRPTPWPPPATSSSCVNASARPRSPSPHSPSWRPTPAPTT